MATAQPAARRGSPLVKVLSCILSKLVGSNDQFAASGPITKFHALHPPDISIADYLDRIATFAACSPECFVLALVYIDRLIQQNNFVLSSLNIHRVIITSVMLAAKFFDDHFYNNSYYAKVGGVPCAEINTLEIEFLFSINFSLHVMPDIYNRYHSELMNHLLTAEGCDCAALGYTRQDIPGMSPPSSSTASPEGASGGGGGGGGGGGPAAVAAEGDQGMAGDDERPPQGEEGDDDMDDGGWQVIGGAS